MLDFACNKDLETIFNFIIEADKVKTILRQSLLFNTTRRENDAEHSWTVCVMALVLKQYAGFSFDMEKVISMLLIHDLVEIDSGDTPLYSQDRESAVIKETQAAERIFGLLRNEQARYFFGLWKEFEEGATNEAKYAALCDRLEPLLQNYISKGDTWKKFNVTRGMAVEKNRQIKEASEPLWEFVLQLLDSAVEKGFLKSG